MVNQRPVKDKEGRPITEIQQQRNRCVEYLEELLNRLAPMSPPDIEAARTDLPIDLNPPTTQEIRMAIRQIKSGKAAGPDSILAEALKSDIEVTTNMLHPLLKKIWEEEQVPMDWKEGHLIKIPKEGDLRKCENYRGITLLSVKGKVFNRVLLNRMKDVSCLNVTHVLLIEETRQVVNRSLFRFSRSHSGAWGYLFKQT
ncbi:unnamed protein product [Schistosoma mattheei]|uniref:Uncharacterized protein n=1 Tax=Schistosoma mattheei TaxID=31246 RepID=A0A183Q5Y8_9TREM|nr:unnamed protein product [Schistosoma mattheei]